MRGFRRVSVAVPQVRVGDFSENVGHTRGLIERADAQGDAVVVFPELGVCGYTARDLLNDGKLLASSEAAVLELAAATAERDVLAVVGAPLRSDGGLFNCAVALHRGEVLGVVPKAYLPTYGEFEEARWFRPGTEVEPGASIRLGDVVVPFGTDLLFEAQGQPDLVLGLEVCEDLWVQVPPSALLVSAGATVVANLSASNFTVGKAELRRMLARSASDRGKCAYLYVAAGPGESSTDLAFDADAFVCENGALLAESERFSRVDQLVTVDLDLDALLHERRRTNTFGDCAREHRRPTRRVPFVPAAPRSGLRRDVASHPFIPRDAASLATRCWEIFEIQSNALATRMAAIPGAKLVLGVSGGLDSTMAALVAANALDLRGQPRADLHCVTMPGLGTTDSTRASAEALVEALGATFSEVPVRDASRLVLDAVRHPAGAGTADVDELLARLREDPSLGDVTLENVQARLRTLVLMTVANQVGGVVVGTGDLSEKALGWSTYAGDHIAMYDVNAGVPKTLIQFVIRWVANARAEAFASDPEALRRILFAVLDTPISPELLPADASGRIAQLTEETLGPYELHDFYLYQFVRHGASPSRILDLATHAFGALYDLEDHRRWLGLFLRRFFHNQFKRSCTADGPKVGMVALSPRGDWRMPSDAKVQGWLDEVAVYEPEGAPG